MQVHFSHFKLQWLELSIKQQNRIICKKKDHLKASNICKLIGWAKNQRTQQKKEEIPVSLTGKANCIALGKEKPLKMVNKKFVFQLNGVKVTFSHIAIKQR